MMSSATLEAPRVHQGWVRQDHTGGDSWPNRPAPPGVIWGSWERHLTLGTATAEADLIYWIETPAQSGLDMVFTTPTGIDFIQAKTSVDDQFDRADLRFWFLARFFSIPPRPSTGDTMLPVLPAADALRAADDLRTWLGATYDDLQAITGIAKNTIHYWRRTGASPRSSTVRRLWRAHALIKALISRLGKDAAITWLRTGPGSPLGALLSGDLEGAEAAVHQVLFRHPTGRPEEREDEAPFRPEPEFEVRTDPATAAVRRASRPPRRGRLTES
jgi:hypothetical protein